MADSLLLTILIVTTASFSRAATSKAGGSSNLLENKLHSIVRTKTKAELISLMGRHDEAERARKECEEQLAAKKIPTSCFRVLDKAGSRRTPPSVTEVGMNSNWLEKVCIRRANETRDLTLLRSALGTKNLPISCRNTIESRKLDLEYTAEVENPVLLFRQQLPSGTESTE